MFTSSQRAACSSSSSSELPTLSRNNFTVQIIYSRMQIREPDSEPVKVECRIKSTIDVINDCITHESHIAFTKTLDEILPTVLDNAICFLPSQGKAWPHSINKLIILNIIQHAHITHLSVGDYFINSKTITALVYLFNGALCLKKDERVFLNISCPHGNLHFTWSSEGTTAIHVTDLTQRQRDVILKELSECQCPSLREITFDFKNSLSLTPDQQNIYETIKQNIEGAFYEVDQGVTENIPFCL